MQEYRKQEIKKSASKFRKQCGCRSYGINDLFNDCKHLGYKVIRYPLGADGHLGFNIKKDLDQVIVVNSSIELGKEIYALAHEIGHALLCEDEKEADYFASCLLMPRHEVDAFLELEVLDENNLTLLDFAHFMVEFKVSFETMLDRLESLSRLTREKRVLIDTKHNRKKISKLLANIEGSQSLMEPSNKTYIPYEYLEYILYNYNHRAIPRETLEKGLSYYHLDLEDVQDQIKITEDIEDDLNLDDFLYEE